MSGVVSHSAWEDQSDESTGQSGLMFPWVEGTCIDILDVTAKCGDDHKIAIRWVFGGDAAKTKKKDIFSLLRDR